MYTITIKDLVTEEVVEVCVYDCIDAVDTTINNLCAVLPHYLIADFHETIGEVA